jgi:hypothetical protein
MLNRHVYFDGAGGTTIYTSDTTMAVDTSDVDSGHYAVVAGQAILATDFAAEIVIKPQGI